MRKTFRLIFPIIILAVSGCGSDDPVSSGEAVADLDNLRVELVCFGPGSSEVNCRTTDVDERSATLDGEAGESYDVTIRLRGVVEQKTYTDYSYSDGMWIEGGDPDGGTWNIFRLHVSSPDKTYYLNSGASGFDECYPLDTQRTIVMDDGAVITLMADAGGDELGTINMDGNGEPIVISGVAPYPYAFDGQFVQMDVVEIKIH